MFESVAPIEGVDYVSLTHGTVAPATFNPSVIEELSPVAVGKSPKRHQSSTHADKRYAMMFVGLETGSRFRITATGQSCQCWKDKVPRTYRYISTPSQYCKLQSVRMESEIRRPVAFGMP